MSNLRLNITSTFFICDMQGMQESEDLFIADPLPQRPPDGGDPSAHLALNLDNTMQSEAADRSALYDEEELDNMAREQYEPVSISLIRHAMCCIYVENEIPVSCMLAFVGYVVIIRVFRLIKQIISCSQIGASGPDRFFFKLRLGDLSLTT